VGRERPYRHAGLRPSLAAAIPNSRFEIVREAGHLPQIEQPEATIRAIDGFLGVE
jgi:pimeloyl-ACP methyl ester carboxylesterase